ncbi:hypothetical protein [Paenalkalicoccus suaedae]|nr:hypothetical protein [Paenalkalicoccus suaedae]
MGRIALSLVKVIGVIGIGVYSAGLLKDQQKKEEILESRESGRK